MRNILSPLDGFSSPFGQRKNPLDRYAANSLRPEYVASFADGFFAVDGVPSTFANALEFTTTGNRTMVDHTGVLKLAPHNYLTYSEDFSNAAWVKTGSPTVTVGVSDPFGGTRAQRVTATSSVDTKVTLNSVLTVGQQKTVKVFARRNAGSGWAYINLQDTADAVWFNLNTGEIGTTGANVTPEIEFVVDDWYLLTAEFAGPGASLVIENASADNSSTATSGDSIDWCFPHAFRSDLGGMADVPLDERVAGSTTYVPTTSAAKYLPRYPAYTYVSGVLTGPYLQIESEARTNLVTYSQDFTDASWVKENLTVTANDATAPCGTLTASRLTNNGTIVEHRVYFNSGSSYTGEKFVFLKEGTTPYVSVSDGNTGVPYGVFNLSNGSIESSSGTAYIKQLGNGWHQVGVLGNINGYLVINIGTTAANAAPGQTYAGSGEYIYAWGAQFTSGVGGSHIPTSGSTVTRPAETLTAPYEALPWGAAVSQSIKGKITYADLASATQVLLYDRRVDANNRITLALDTAGANTGKFALTMVVGGVSATISTTAELTPGIDQDFNVAFACTSTEVAIALNGTAETRVSHAIGLPALSTTDATFAGMVYQDTLLGWAADIGNAGLAEATA